MDILLTIKEEENVCFPSFVFHFYVFFFLVHWMKPVYWLSPVVQSSPVVKPSHF